MKNLKVEDAVGMVLAHDLTKVIPGEYKGVAFKKGHIIRQEDIEILKDMGKNHINIFTIAKDELHEEEAASRAAIAVEGEGIYLTEPSEGKVSVRAKEKSLLKVNTEALEKINEVEGIILSTLHNNTLVRKDQIVAGVKVIPLVISKANIERIENVSRNYDYIIQTKPLFPLKTGIVVTGSEVYYGRIKDGFAPVLEKKIVEIGGTVIKTLYAPDEQKEIEDCIIKLMNEGAELVMVSGGMSVDADDVTPKAIEAAASKVISYGSPVLPGAMFMAAYRNRVPVIGIPACGMFNKITVLDILLPRVFAKEEITKKDIVSLAHGGLCLGCEVCRYPVCPLGK